ncbi:MAG: nicotinate (nicotinamide) nucleotide adenylyltransferase [Merdibacter sp.]
MNKKKIAVLGGSFDPIHKGHLQIAKQAVAMGMDEVWFMPTYDTPLKDRNLTHSTHRLEMIKRAIAPYRRFHCCCIEIEREGKSYTIDTVRTLKREYPDADFYWLIGSDQANQMDAWKEPKELTSLVQFIVFSRRGAQQESPYPLLYQPMELVDVSSSEIRAGKKMELPGSRRSTLYSGTQFISGKLCGRSSFKEAL